MIEWMDLIVDELIYLVQPYVAPNVDTVVFDFGDLDWNEA